MKSKALKLRLLTPGCDFVRVYVERLVPGIEIVDGPSCDFTVAVATDRASLDAVQADVKLLCATIIGTGMTGTGMTLAKAVADGKFMHIKGNEAIIDLVHAVDVAQAVALTLGKPGQYTVTDGRNHRIDDLADALAYRINDRRLYTVGPRWSRVLVMPWLRRLITADQLMPVAAGYKPLGECVAEYAPVDVTDYLKTHVYDDESL